MLISKLRLSLMLALLVVHSLTSSSAWAVQVVATNRPLHALVAAVMDGSGSVPRLAPGKGDPHGVALRPSEIQALAAADLVFWMGPALEPGLLRPLQAVTGKAALVAMLDLPELRRHSVRSQDDWQKNSQKTHSHVGIDGHVWLDPTNAALMTRAIAQALAMVDPAHAAQYAQNAQQLAQRLHDLDIELADLLRPVQQRPFIVFHDAYQYFQARYGLNGVGALTINPEIRPSAAHLARLRDQIRSLGAVCVFAEPTASPNLLAALTEGNDARQGILDPEGLGIEPGPDLYFQLMRGNAGAMADCLRQ